MLQYIIADIYIHFGKLLIIKKQNYFGSSYYTLIFAVRFWKKALVLNKITHKKYGFNQK